MDKIKQDKLFVAFDYMFRKRNLSAQESTMYWGLSVDDGWFQLLWNLCTAIQIELNKPGNEQLKKDFAMSS